MKGDEIVRPFHRHSNETATVKIHVNKDKLIRKWMSVFLVKFENRGIKIARVNSSLITKISIYFNFVWRWGSVVMSTF